MDEQDSEARTEAHEKTTAPPPVLMALVILAVTFGPKAFGFPTWVQVVAFTLMFPIAVFLTFKADARFVQLAERSATWTVSPLMQVFVGLLAMTPGWLVYAGTQWTSQSAPAWVQSIVVAFAALLLVWCLRQIYVPGGQERLHARLGSSRGLLSIALAGNLLFASMGLFSSFVLLFRPGEFFTGTPHHGQVADFFLWHFCKMIPLLDLNETVHWSRPLVVPDAHKVRVGWLILAFKVSVAIPTLWLCALYFKPPKEPAKVPASTATPSA